MGLIFFLWPTGHHCRGRHQLGVSISTGRQWRKEKERILDTSRRHEHRGSGLRSRLYLCAQFLWRVTPSSLETHQSIPAPVDFLECVPIRDLRSIPARLKLGCMHSVATSEHFSGKKSGSRSIPWTTDGKSLSCVTFQVDLSSLRIDLRFRTDLDPQRSRVGFVAELESVCCGRLDSASAFGVGCDSSEAHQQVPTRAALGNHRGRSRGALDFKGRKGTPYSRSSFVAD